MNVKKEWKTYRFGDLIPKEHWVRQMENIFDPKWIEKKARPYCGQEAPELSPVPLTALVTMQHLTGAHTLAEAYDRLGTELPYMWAVGCLPADRPSLQAFCTLCGVLPQELLTGIFERVISRCVARDIGVEREDGTAGPLYELSMLPAPEQPQAARQMAAEWVGQLFMETRELESL